MLSAGRGNRFGPLAGRAWGAISDTRPRLRMQVNEFARLHRLAEIVTLALGAAVLQKSGKLLRCLHALCDHAHIQTPAHADHQADDRGIAGARGNVAHERLVDLQCIDREALQMAQARIARAEVIQRKPHTHLAQRMQHCGGRRRVLHQEGFGQLELEMLRSDAGLRDDVAARRQRNPCRATRRRRC